MKRPYLKNWPQIIQGGMGVNVSGWKLAQAVSNCAQLGVVSGVALDQVMTRKLQLGDPGGHIQRALKSFPNSKTVERILEKYFHREKGTSSRRFLNPPMLTVKLKKDLQELLVVSNFVEVFLAKEGHDKPVGINYLEKIQMATVPSLYGAMLAGVSFVLMGAGIPRDVPGAMDLLAQHQEVALPITVENSSKKHFSNFSPEEIMGEAFDATPIDRPYFFPIVSSNVLAITLAKKATGKVDGFIVEGDIAGGHNAPPRGNVKDEHGNPVYGPRDIVNLEKLKTLGLPFWLAGGYGSAEKLQEALSQGAQGIQVGSVFAVCEESNLDEEWKRAILSRSLEGNLDVRTDGKASPTGFPFKVAQLPETVSNKETFDNRKRICDVGCLRKVYETEKGDLAYRCPAEPMDQYLRKGGNEEEALEARCLCNGLLSNVGLAQAKGDVEEPSIITLGDTPLLKELLESKTRYTAEDVIKILEPTETT